MIQSILSSARGAGGRSALHTRSRCCLRNNFSSTRKYAIYGGHRPFSSLDHDDHHDQDHQHHHGPVTVFTEDEIMVRDAVRQWARTDLLPAVRDMDDASQLRPDILRALFENGHMGLEIPVEHGGSGLSFTSACLVVEEISRVDPSVAILVDIHNTLVNNAVRFWGSKDLQERWLPRLAADTVSSFCLSEAGSGSDAFSLKMTAVPSPNSDYYTLNGTKLWISSALQAGVFLVFANVNPAAGYKGITAFMVTLTRRELQWENQKTSSDCEPRRPVLSPLIMSRWTPRMCWARSEWDTSTASTF